ncbi:MAG TPA: nuclear transport factor 2 family protein [Steroidobacteraceae bacterium]|jgi:hypothetical protein|nr:nuclear transport factor 2 family protein [Steroidobacteraceae bacterium]
MSTRRAFVLKGGAALGAGVAATVAGAGMATGAAGHAATKGGASRPPDAATAGGSREQDPGSSSIEDREALRRLQLTFAALLEDERYEAAAALFDEHAHLQLSGASARGRAAISHLFASSYRLQEAPVIHRAYRHRADDVRIGEDRLRATATFHVDADLCTPLQDDCTIARMARLQGNVADRRWETGRLEAEYVKTGGEWKIASLTYVPA